MSQFNKKINWRNRKQSARVLLVCITHTHLSQSISLLLLYRNTQIMIMMIVASQRRYKKNLTNFPINTSRVFDYRIFHFFMNKQQKWKFIKELNESKRKRKIEIKIYDKFRTIFFHIKCKYVTKTSEFFGIPSHSSVANHPDLKIKKNTCENMLW